MTENNKIIRNFPTLRFPEFDGEWELKRLGDLTDVITKGTTPKKFVNQGVKYIKIECFDGNKINLKKCLFINEETHNKELRRSILKENDLLFAIAGATIGKINIVTNDILPANTNQALAIIRLKKNENSKFIYQILKSDIMQKYIKDSISVGAQPNLNLQQMNDFSFFYPTSSEQLKISSLLNQVDERIQTQKKIIRDLEMLKSNLAQKIFNQKIRLKSDTNNAFSDWKTKKLGEVCNIKRGASPRPISDTKWFDENSKIGWVRISDVSKSNKYLEKTEQYLSNIGVSKSRLVKKGNMIMSICATIGKPIYTNFDVCIHDGFVVFENLSLNKEYLYYYLDFIQLNWYKYGQPGTQVNLNSEIVNNEAIPVPVMEEQNKIAQFLSSIDEKINLEKDLLSKYEMQKKYLFANIFV